ncbi:MAG: TonB-dependent receptor [Bacteroidetes bacterium]|nr:TonB-dependent receptor [Bacteroidota bacterium]
MLYNRLIPYLILAVLCFIPFAFLSGQTERYTVSGTISDQETGETLIGATVTIPELSEGTTTNEYGYYSITLSKGQPITIEISYVGFQPFITTLPSAKDTIINIELITGIQLDEVVVKANSFKEQINSSQMSVEAITAKEAKLLPAVLGEVDILKIIQLKPGIPSGSEGTTGLFVRGGGSDQNLIVLDEAVVYNPNHLFGFFSTFNADAVKDLRLYKGGFPPQYGGRLSSVIDVKLKEGNNKKFSGTGGIGIISSRLTLEGPIQKERSSFIVSGRRTYVDLITQQVNRTKKDSEDYTQIPDYYFYDLNTKVNYQLSDKDRLFLSGYFGRDVFGFESDFFNFNFDWGNATGTARWNHVFSPRLFANTTFTYSDYQYNIQNEVTGFSFNLGSRIKDVNFKSDFYYNPNPHHSIRFGGNITQHNFEVGRLKAGSDDGDISFSAGQNFDAMEMGLYFSDEFLLGKKWKFNGGLRLSGTLNDGTFYSGIEPRIATKYSLSERMSLKGSYARMYQYMHLVSNTGVSLPTDIWYPSTKDVKPQRSDQVALGFSYLLGEKFLINNEYYYKWLHNQLEFVDGAQLFANDKLEEEFAIGKGYAYGMELSIEKQEGRLTGWIGYTLALIKRGDFETLAEGKIFGMGSRYFSPVYDRRHDLSVVGMFEISRRFTATASYVYGSGDLTWLPLGRYSLQGVHGANFQSVVPVFGDRNNYRLIPYQRLDVGMMIKFFPKWGESDLTLSVINALDRRNAYFIYLEPELREVENNDGFIIELPERIAAKQVSLFPILPSLTWNFSF